MSSARVREIVRKETASMEQRLQKVDDVPVSSLDKQENVGFLDTTTPLLEPTQPKSEGKFFCAYTSGNYMPPGKGRHFLLMEPVCKLIVLETPKNVTSSFPLKNHHF